MSDEEMVDVELSNRGEVIPGKTDKIALIDADTLVFATCVSMQYYEDLMPDEFYGPDELELIISDNNYDPIENRLYGIDLERAIEVCKDKIERICDLTGCSDFELHFTGTRSSFRYFIAPQGKPYKGNRNDRPPTGLGEIKQYFVNSGKGILHSKWEADDAVVCLKENYPDKYVLCALDKDVIYSVAGTHFNYYESDRYSISMKFVEVSEETALKNPFVQALTGDGSDNIAGISGIGKVKANKALKDCTTELECWKVVKKIYEDNGLFEEDAKETVRLVHMHQLTKVNGEFILNLWEVPNE